MTPTESGYYWLHTPECGWQIVKVEFGDHAPQVFEFGWRHPVVLNDYLTGCTFGPAIVNNPDKTHYRMQFREFGKHVEVKVYCAPAANLTYALTGELRFEKQEFEDFKAMLGFPNVEFVAENS